MNEQKKVRAGMMLFTVFSAVVCIYPAMLVLPFFAQHRFCLLLLNALAITLCLLLCRASSNTWIVSEGIVVGIYLIALLLDGLPIQADVSVLVFISVHHVFLTVLTTLAVFIKNCFQRKYNRDVSSNSVKERTE